jgi:hypothetical protein
VLRGGRHRVHREKDDEKIGINCFPEQLL